MAESVLARNYRVGFDIEAREVGLNGGPGRHRISEDLQIDAVHRSEIGHVAQVPPAPHGVGKRGSGGGGNRLEVAERLACLFVECSFNLGTVGPKWSLTSKEEQTAAAACLRLWAGFLGSIRRL